MDTKKGRVRLGLAMPKGKMTLNQARKAEDLERFIAQEEARGVSGGDLEAMEEALRTASKEPLAKRRTSRSQGRGSSGGSQTR